jgi:hypothetical protein
MTVSTPTTGMNDAIAVLRLYAKEARAIHAQ